LSKIDYKKDLKNLYNPPPKEINIIEVPKLKFLQIDGQGNPNTSQVFKDAVDALYGLSYALSLWLKKVN